MELKMNIIFSGMEQKKTGFEMFLTRSVMCDTDPVCQAMGASGPGELAVFLVGKEVPGPTQGTPSEPVGVFAFHP